MWVIIFSHIFKEHKPVVSNRSVDLKEGSILNIYTLDLLHLQIDTRHQQFVGRHRHYGGIRLVVDIGTTISAPYEKWIAHLIPATSNAKKFIDDIARLDINDVEIELRAWIWSLYYRILIDHADQIIRTERFANNNTRHRCNLTLLGEDRFDITILDGGLCARCPVGYTKSIFNADYFLNDMTIGHIPVWSSADLTVARNRAREARASMKDTSRSWAHWLRDASIWLGGSQAQETAKKFVIELLQTDLDQELQLGTSGGLKRVREAYRQRFYTSDDQKTLYQAREDRVFGLADADDAEADVAYNDAGTLPGVIATCRNTLEQMEVRLEEADRLQRSLDAILGDSKTQQRRKKRSQL